MVTILKSHEDETLNEAKAELEETLSKFGWKWAVLASTAGKLYEKRNPPSKDVINHLRMSRTQIESGCYSVCDIANELREIEKELFSKLMNFGSHSTDQFLELLGKAISGKITKNDLDITAAKPILPDCLTIPCVCRE
ncbi:MAG: hypothetical protein ACXACU_00940 [Candidatus Hodarchaeales archaeon]|jgi:hypothetical protein